MQEYDINLLRDRPLNYVSLTDIQWLLRTYEKWRRGLPIKAHNVPKLDYTGLGGTA